MGLDEVSWWVCYYGCECWVLGRGLLWRVIGFNYGEYGICKNKVDVVLF